MALQIKPKESDSRFQLFGPARRTLDLFSDIHSEQLASRCCTNLKPPTQDLEVKRLRKMNQNQRC